MMHLINFDNSIPHIIQTFTQFNISILSLNIQSMNDTFNELCVFIDGISIK